MAKPNDLLKPSPHIKFALLFIPFLFVGWLPVFFAQTLPFQHLTLGKGQDINMVYQILQDGQGFIWFSTFDGLVRYDGYRFKHIPFDPETKHPLKGKRTNDLLESASGNIWMVSGWMLLCYNPKQDSFYTINNLGGDSLFQYNNSLRNDLLLQDAAGHIWLRSWNGLFKIKENESGPPFGVEHFHRIQSDSFSLSSDTVHVLLYDSFDKLWVGTKNGLNFYDRENDRFNQLHQLGNEVVTSLFETSSGKICIGTRFGGLFIFDPEKNTIENYLPDKRNETSIAGKYVKQIAEDGQGNIWLLAGTSKTQVLTLQKFDLVNKQFYAYSEPLPPNGLNKNNIAHMFVDRKGFLWVATGYSLKRFDPNRELFTAIKQREKYLKDWRLVFTFFEDREGILWMGTGSRGVLKYAPTTDKFRYYPPAEYDGENKSWGFSKATYVDSRGYFWWRTPLGTDRYYFDKYGELQKESHFPFRGSFFSEDSHNRLWIGGKNGLVPFDLERGKLIPPSKFSNLKGLTNFGIEDREGWLWSASWTDGLRRYNPSTGEIIHFKRIPKNTRSIASNKITPFMLEDVKGNIWFNGVNGLKNYHFGTNDFSNYLKGIETVYSLWGSDSILWATTSGRGLCRLNTNTGNSICYTPKNGFPTLRPISIFKDANDDLWMSSDVGIIHFDPDTGTSELYDESDGLPSVVFGYGSCQRKNGEFFFPLWDGGFVRFHPDSLRDDPTPPRPTIVDFRLFNKPVKIGGKNSPLPQAIWASEHLILEHDQNNFTLGFTAFHFAAPAHNQFLYKMEGSDMVWNDPGEQRSVNFADLSPGHYDFKLKAANHDSVWSKPIALKITILPPWWATWWAYCIYAIIFSGLFYTYYRLQLHRRLAEAEALRLREQFSQNGWFRLMQNNGLQFHDDFLKKLNRVLEENYANENFDILQLCEGMHISRAQLYRKVKALTGQPVGQVLRSYRLRRAKTLLETTDLSVSQVALEVGFKHLAHFSRTFHEEFGANPSEMRK